MDQHITAIYESGVLKPLTPLDLREQELVSLVVSQTPSSTQPSEPPDQSLSEMLDEVGLVGCVKDGPADLSTNPRHMEGFGKSGD